MALKCADDWALLQTLQAPGTLQPSLELDAAREAGALLRTADTNQNGALDLAELAGHFAHSQLRIPHRADSLTHAEHALAYHDTDKSGAITKGELTAGLQQWAVVLARLRDVLTILTAAGGEGKVERLQAAEKRLDRFRGASLPSSGAVAASAFDDMQFEGIVI